MHPRVVAIACDRNYFPGLQALVNSVHTYHPELPIFVFERGFRAAEFAWLANHPATIEVQAIARFPFPVTGMWEAKQQVPAECLSRARSVCLIDADIVVLSRLDDVFELAEDGKIVAGCDGMGSYFDSAYQVYGPSVVGKRWFHLNSGLVCFDVHRHWDLAGLWAFSSNYGAYSPHGGYPLGLPGLGDQGLLDGVMALLNKDQNYHRLPLHSWHDFRRPGHMKITEVESGGQLTVENTFVHQRQRIAHCIGLKWWKPGADSFHPSDDKLRCFRHFANLDLRPGGNGKLRSGYNGSNGHFEKVLAENGATDGSRLPLSAYLLIHCTEAHEKRAQVEACLSQWRVHHPKMPGILISDGVELWHAEVATDFGLEYHEGFRCRRIEYGSLWLSRALTLGIDGAKRHGADVLWQIHSDTLIQRPFQSAPPVADWFGHIHNSDAPHIHGGSSFLRLSSATRLLDRLGDYREFNNRERWMPSELADDVKRWAERTGWISAEYIIASVQDDLGFEMASWPEVHAVCGLTPLPDDKRRYAVLHPVRLPLRW